MFAELPELWLPPSNYAVTPMLGWWEHESPVWAAEPDEVHEVHRVPISELVGPDHRISVRHPSGWVGPGYLIGTDNDLVLWGFTAGIIARLFDYVGWADVLDDAPVHTLPDYMLQGRPPGAGWRYPVNFLDWLLVGLVLLYALSGYWQGFVTGAFATAGLLLGGLIGVWLAPFALGDAAPSLLVSLGALFIVIVSASIGQALLQFGGARIRDHIRWQPVRALDAVGGAALSAAAVLLVSWALGVAVSGSGITGITAQVRNSAVLGQVDQVLPAAADDLLGAFNDVVGAGFFPRYLEPFAPERIVGVRPGPERILTDPDVEDAEASVLKIRGNNSCGRGVEGSGFVYADGRVMTNAHVVAGVPDPEVEINGDAVSAEVVHYDPDLDVAVLAVDTSGLPALELRPDRVGGRRRGDPRLPPGRPVRRAARPDPCRAAAPLARHLRRRHRDPRGVLRSAAWSDPATPAGRSSPRRATPSGSSSPPRSPTATPATRSPRPGRPERCARDLAHRPGARPATALADGRVCMSPRVPRGIMRFPGVATPEKRRDPVGILTGGASAARVVVSTSSTSVVRLGLRGPTRPPTGGGGLDGLDLRGAAGPPWSGRRLDHRQGDPLTRLL